MVIREENPLGRACEHGVDGFIKVVGVHAAQAELTEEEKGQKFPRNHGHERCSLETRD